MNAQQALLDTLTVSTKGAIAGAVGQLCAGTIDTDHFLAIVIILLLMAHERAAQYGRHLAGDFSSTDDLDKEFAEHVMDGEKSFLDSFVQDIKDGRYNVTTPDGKTTLDEQKIAARAGLYAGRLTGTANQAWIGALDAETLIYWVLGGNENHCGACPELAEGGPYTPATLPTVPGANETPCLFYCYCHLEANGVTSFTTTL